MLNHEKKLALFEELTKRANPTDVILISKLILAEYVFKFLIHISTFYLN
jgi:hypothetical protein